MNPERMIRICLVEDDARLRSLMVRWLQHEPDCHLVGQHADGESALRAVLRGPGRAPRRHASVQPGAAPRRS